MNRIRSSRASELLAALLVAVGALASGACDDGFRQVDAGIGDASVVDGPSSPPDGGVDASVGDLSPVPDAALDSAPKPPPDNVCAEPWSKATKSESSCAPRRTFDIATKLTTQRRVAVTRAPSGVVAISFELRTGPDEGELHIARFDAGKRGDTAPGKATLITVKPSGRFERLGVTHDITAAANGDLHATYLMFSSFGHHVGYVSVPATSSAASPQETVATGVPEVAASVGIALEGPSASPHVVYFHHTNGQLRSRRRVGGKWQTDQIVKSGFDNRAPGVAALDVIGDSSGVHVAYHFGITFALSHPRYGYAGVGGGWSLSTTLDHNAPTTIAGFGIDLAVQGTERWAAYFVRGGSGAGAALRLAQWSGSAKPTISIVAQGIDDSASSPRYSVAADVDPFGRLHVVYVDVGSTGERLVYARQVSVAGSLKWLEDVIDPDVGGTELVRVDIVVDAAARPHIAYFSAKDIAVRYATRFDR